jgi:hypothetical protein
MVEVLSVHVWVWNIKIGQSHFKKGNWERRRKMMKGMNETGIQLYTYIYKREDEFKYDIFYEL